MTSFSDRPREPNSVTFHSCVTSHRCVTSYFRPPPVPFAAADPPPHLLPLILTPPPHPRLTPPPPPFTRKELESNGKSPVGLEMPPPPPAEVMGPPSSKSPGKPAAKRSRVGKSGEEQARAGGAKKGMGGKTNSSGALHVTPLPPQKQGEPDSKEQRLSTGSLLDMLTELNDVNDPAVAQRLAQGLSIETSTPLGLDPAPSGYCDDKEAAKVPESVSPNSPNSGHLSPLNPVQLNDILTSF